MLETKKIQFLLKRLMCAITTTKLTSYILSLLSFDIARTSKIFAILEFGFGPVRKMANLPKAGRSGSAWIER